MNIYKVFFKGRSTVVKAETSLKAQEVSAKIFKTKKAYDVTVVLVDKTGNSNPYQLF